MPRSQVHSLGSSLTPRMNSDARRVLPHTGEIKRRKLSFEFELCVAAEYRCHVELPAIVSYQITAGIMC